MPILSLGIALWAQCTPWTAYLETARLADRLGYDSLWTFDHLCAPYGDPDQDIFEAYTVIGAWGQATSRATIGLQVGANTLRNPALVAKSITTLDHVTGGRAVLGIGSGWFEREHRAYGIEFGRSPGERLDWLDEAVGAMRSLLDGGTVTSGPDGHYAYHDLRQAPRPLHRVPIMIGGQGRQKTLRTVARHADIWNASGTPVEIRELVGVLGEHCAAVGRDPSEIRHALNTWIVVRDDPAEARRAWDAMIGHNGKGQPNDLTDARPITGTAEQVAGRIRAYMEAGIDTLITEFPAPFDIETIERLIGELRPMLVVA